MKILQKNICKVTAFIIVLLFISLTIKAQNIQIETIEKRFNFKTTDGQDSLQFEPSAIESINETTFLIADDENDGLNNSLAIFDASSGKLLSRRLQIKGLTKNPKWESMAKDADCNFYISGSHSADVSDGMAKFKSRSHIYRFRLKDVNDLTKIDIDQDSVKELDIKDSLIALGLYNADDIAKSRAKIEGLAFQTNADNTKELIIGLREPEGLVRVYSAIPVTLNNNDLEKLSLKPFLTFNAEKVDNVNFKLSSIEYIADWKGFLIITSTETTEIASDGKEKPVFHGNALWFISDEMVKNAQPAKLNDSLTAIAPQKIWQFGMKVKAEGVCLIQTSKEGVKIAIVFDNDGKKANLPGMIQFLELSQWKN